MLCRVLRRGEGVNNTPQPNTEVHSVVLRCGTLAEHAALAVPTCRLAPVMTVVRTSRTRSVAACRTSSSEHLPSMRARGLGVGEYYEEERPCMQLHSSTGSSCPSCIHLAAGVHPTAYSPRRRPLRASRDESRKSEHVCRREMNAATRDMAALAEAARCAASKCRAKRWVTSPVRTPRVPSRSHIIK